MSGRVEIIAGPERRRRWSEEEKLQLVAEACRPGYSVSQVARRRGINASQLFAWRRQALARGLITDNRRTPSAAPALTFAPVEIVEEPATEVAGEKVRQARRRKGPRACAVSQEIQCFRDWLYSRVKQSPFSRNARKPA